MLGNLYRGIKRYEYLKREWVEGYLAKGYLEHAPFHSDNDRWCLIRKEEASSDNGDDYCMVSYEINKDTLSTFTGYVDNKSNKIWTKSIVKITCSDNEFELPCRYYLVTFDEEHKSFILQNIHDNTGHHSLLNILMFNNYELEVVGDLYHDGDLLHT